MIELLLAIALGAVAIYLAVVVLIYGFFGIVALYFKLEDDPSFKWLLVALLIASFLVGNWITTL